uniref:Uncharacterized protein n=1 Tax=Oryza barthii TaxID=65489 RepID=A0A0D3HAF1_9ORYZ
MPRSYMPRASTTFPSPHLRSRRCIGRCPRRTRPRALVSFDPVYSGSCFGSSFSSLYDPVYLCYPLDTSDPWMQARTRSHQRRAVVRGTTTSTLGGPIQTVHAVAEHGDPLVLQPVSQVLREFSVLYVAKVRTQDVRRNDCAGFVLRKV